MFDLLNEIEDCPATLLSANRHFIAKCDVKIFIFTEGVFEKFENILKDALLQKNYIIDKFYSPVVDFDLKLNKRNFIHLSFSTILNTFDVVF